MNLIGVIESTLIRLTTRRSSFPSAEADGKASENTFLMGTTLADGDRSDASGTEVRLSDEDLFRHIYLVGASGSGKSTLLLRLVDWEVAACR